MSRPFCDRRVRALINTSAFAVWGALLPLLLISISVSSNGSIRECMPNYRRWNDANTTAGNRTASNSERLRLSDFVQVVLTHKARQNHAVAANRAWRRLGVPAIFVTDMSDAEVAALNANSSQTNEYWFRVADSSPEEGFSRPFIRRAVLSPFVVNDTPLKDKYKYIFMADDDTVVNFYALRHILQGWDHDIPYVITDGFMHNPTTMRPNDKSYTYSSYLAPRCLPCHLDRNPLTSNLITVPGRGGFAPELGCPCTLETACKQRPRPDIPYLGANTVDCMAGVRNHHIPCIFGGYGMVFSRGLLKCPPFNSTASVQEALRGFLLTSPPDRHAGGDILVSRLLAHHDVWVTDPATYWWEQHQDLPMDGEAKPYRSFGGYPGTDGWQLFDRVLDGSCFKDFSGCLRHVLSEVSRHHPADLLVWTEKAIAAWHVLVHNMTVLHDWGRNTGTPGEAVR